MTGGLVIMPNSSITYLFLYSLLAFFIQNDILVGHDRVNRPLFVSPELCKSAKNNFQKI